MIAERDKPFCCLQHNKTNVKNNICSVMSILQVLVVSENSFFLTQSSQTVYECFWGIGCSLVVNCKDYQF